MTFFQRNARFIVPLPWLLLTAMKLWQAVHVGHAIDYVGALAFALIAAMFYIGQRQLYIKRRQESAPT